MRPMRRLCLSLLPALAAISGAAWAEPLFTAAKSPGGIAFWHRLREDLPKAAVVAGWRDGLSMAPGGKPGLIPLATSVASRGGGGRSANEINEAMNDLSANGGLFADEWNSIASLQAAPDKLAEAAKIAALELVSPNLEQRELDRARKGLGDRIREGQTNAERIAQLAAALVLYGDHPLTRRNEPETLSAVTREDIAQWHKTALTRQNMVVAVSGNAGPEVFGPIVDAWLGGLPEKSDLPEIERPDPKFRPLTIVIEKDQPQTILLVLADTKVKQDREQLRASIGIDILGGGLESRIVGNLRQKLGAAYSARAQLAGMPAHRLLAMGGPVDNDKAQAALAAIGEEYELWRRDGVTEAEFQASRSRIGVQVNLSFDRLGADANDFVNTVLSGRPPNDSADFEARLASYSRDAINADIAARFLPGPFLTLIVAPSAAPFKADCVVKDWRDVLKCR